MHHVPFLSVLLLLSIIDLFVSVWYMVLRSCCFLGCVFVLHIVLTALIAHGLHTLPNFISRDRVLSPFQPRKSGEKFLAMAANASLRLFHARLTASLLQLRVFH